MSLTRPSLFCMTAILAAGCAQAHIVRMPPAEGGIAAASPSLPAGEDLEYRISWWGVPVGTVTVSTRAGPQEWVTVRLEGRSNKTLQAFYPVRVEIESVIDPKAVAPVRFRAAVKRRWRVHESTILFDRAKGTAFHQLPKGKTATVPAGPATQDGLSVIPYVRTLDLQVGRAVPLEISADGKNWPLAGKILKVGRMQLKGLGSWTTVEGSAQLAYPVPFFQGAKAWIWFSADPERVPLLAKIHSRIGPVTVVLLRRRGGD